MRDGAEWAWVPSGDSCAFCIALASRGWETASQKALKGNHAQHIHANCDCTYAIRFDGESKYESYDPAKYKEIYDNASDGNSYEKINAIRREKYKLNKDEINASKRINYESLKSRKESRAVAKSGKNGIIKSKAEEKQINSESTSIQPTIDTTKVYQEAKDGVRHSGVYRDASKKTEQRLLKSIKSHEEQVRIHTEKVREPEKYDAEWNSKTQREKDGLLRKWRKDIQRNAEQAAIEKETFRERFGENK